MSTITKLNYVSDTKDLIKDKLNEYGAGITDNDTFRSYVDKIKGIYNNWPKVTGEGTEITLTPTRKGRMQLDLKGNTEQPFVLPLLPTGYTALEYIESTSYAHNSNYIDTNIYPNNNTKIEIDLMIREKDGHSFDRIFGATNALFSSYCSMFVNANCRLLNKYNNKDQEGLALLKYAKRYKFIRDKNKIYINNELKAKFQEEEFQDENPLRLFSSFTGDRDGKIAIYMCKIWDNDTLVRDFVPCKNPNNEVGLYDLVSNTFFENKGTIDFVAGDEITKSIHVVTGNNTISIGSTNYPINLGSIELCKIGDYQDYLYKENGNWYKYGAITKIILDGTENWKKSGLYNGSYYIDKGTSSKFYIVTEFSPLLCSHFIRANINYVAQISNYKQGDCFVENTKGNFNVWYDDGTIALNDFKTWLSENNLVVYCVLKSPTTTQITDETLIAQLEAISNAMSSIGTTTISQTNADLPFIINASALRKGGN